jgi:hypothetical protein
MKWDCAEAFSVVVTPRHFSAKAAGVRVGWLNRSPPAHWSFGPEPIDSDAAALEVVADCSNDGDRLAHGDGGLEWRHLDRTVGFALVLPSEEVTLPDVGDKPAVDRPDRGLQRRPCSRAPGWNSPSSQRMKNIACRKYVSTVGCSRPAP